MSPVSSLDITDYSITRALQLRELRDVIRQKVPHKRVFQQLSWHARRRTMSHTSHRVPYRIRARHIKQLQQQGAEKLPGIKGSRRCRKYRRKARFLVAIRNLRMADARRSEMHIWHAKRFKMTTIGGRFVAYRGNDRGYRSNFREVKRGAVGHDASYMRIVEVEGKIDDVKAMLKAHTSEYDGGRCTTKSALAGRRRVSNVILLKDGAAVAPVDVLWRPNRGQVWLITRPEAAQAVIGVTEAKLIRDHPIIFSFLGPRSGVILWSVLGKDAEAIGRTRSAGCFPRGYVHAGRTEDPRKRFPPRDIGARMQQVGTGDMRASMETMDSQLWEEGWRNEVRECRLKNIGCEIDFMVLSRAGVHGWDLVIPRGWGMAFWMSLMYAANQRAIGLECLRWLDMEREHAVFPEEYLDMEVAQKSLREVERELNEKHLRRPKSKRVDFGLYEINSPYFPDLAAVARSEGMLMPATAKRGRMEMGEVCIARTNENVLALPLRREDCGLFVRMRVRMESRGVPTSNAMVYEPSEEDLRMWDDGKWGGFRHEKGVKRLCIGRVVMGAFRLQGGAGGGNALVSATALQRIERELRNGKKRKAFRVLVRNVHSLHYRPATVEEIKWE